MEKRRDQGRDSREGRAVWREASNEPDRAGLRARSAGPARMWAESVGRALGRPARDVTRTKASVNMVERMCSISKQSMAWPKPRGLLVSVWPGAAH